MCLKQIINAGIVRIVAGKMYPDKLSEELLKDSGILFEVYKNNASGETPFTTPNLCEMSGSVINID